jgi:queuine tRNA-ribosyltransferase
MKNADSGLVPVMTSLAGNCLTEANWQEAGVNIASYYLSALLMKPGFEFLKTLADLASYVGWHKTLVLNASSLGDAVEGRYALRSHFDGSCSHYSIEEIVDLIATLQPNLAILPKGISQMSQTWWESFPETILPFVHVTDISTCSQMVRPYGVYFTYDKTVGEPSAIFQQLELHKNKTCYIMGDLGLPLMLDLVKQGANYLESDIPASDAYQGSVYSHDGVIALGGSACKMQFDVVDKRCRCPICTQNFTRAYLHHLLEQTPLLCQRYLIQHNVYFCVVTYDSHRNAILGAF